MAMERRESNLPSNYYLKTEVDSPKAKEVPPTIAIVRSHNTRAITKRDNWKGCSRNWRRADKTLHPPPPCHHTIKKYDEGSNGVWCICQNQTRAQELKWMLIQRTCHTTWCNWLTVKISIGVISDIEKEFLNVSLQAKDRDVIRFLWLCNTETTSINYENLEVYRFCMQSAIWGGITLTA